MSAAWALRRGQPGQPADAERTENPVIGFAERRVAADAGAWKEKVERRLEGDGGPGFEEATGDAEIGDGHVMAFA
ncbi:MAG: hypothetical protein V4529_02985 [Gemmatimonadota bacterium]